jgi:tRNA/tmRNA/rRNA uracil-C5-methylase (TrmA/RlmC/RlmD family)
VVVVDPPRPGCGPRVIKRLLEVRPPRIVYVSCNPQALAADLALLSEAYEVGPLQPLDMFPQTAHVECVAGLTVRP